jgi:hypothetical protein
MVIFYWVEENSGPLQASIFPLFQDFQSVIPLRVIPILMCKRGDEQIRCFENGGLDICMYVHN